MGNFSAFSQEAEEAPEDSQQEAPEQEPEFLNFSDPFEPSLPALQPEMPQEVLEEGPDEPQGEIVPPALTVKGTVWGTKQPRAIINDGIYGEGDMIAGTDARVLRINETGILYEYQTKKFLMKRSEWSGVGKEAT
ncbi:MAG: hypothetical protein WC732_07620 [Candidatus Omnitrophota bacterium]